MPASTLLDQHILQFSSHSTEYSAHLAVLEDELACVAAAHAQLVQLLRSFETWRASLHNERSDTVRALVRRRLHV
jgi:hypothetical protein